ncbi:omptin family outer membrane protease [Chitinophaga sp. S165]|uniref:omptin family outer membrane protease n=1 Tax=Chitinophaga sp. S165 TaxID=2135462 RepID=UPI001304DFF8|nr:omptin family outer membrane protease [Chitinophaga sp. S165]
MKSFLLNVIFLFSFVAVNAQYSSPVMEVALSGGYQTADLRWSIAGNGSGQSPNILSEVKWHALSGPSLDARGRFNVTNRLFITGEVSKCFIKAGNATDTDYADDDRGLPTYSAQLDADEGRLSAVRFYGGYNFLQRAGLRITVFVGYAENREFLFLLNHAQYIPGERNLRCTYNTSWKGISGGLSGRYRATSWLELTGELQYSQMNYKATADWNLIDAFQHPVSFKQEARGFDLKMSVTCAFRLRSYLSLFTSGTYSRAETGTGTDELFLESGAVQTTQFNGAFTHAKKIAIGALVQF